MRAIILAAGAGTRLRPVTAERPKCLVPVGQRTLLDWQVDALRSVDVEEIVVVVGYQADQVRRRFGRALCYVVNQAWATTNSIYSFHLVRQWLVGELLLFNCDILFHPEALRRLLAVPGNALAVDRRAARRAGEMNAQIGADGVIRGLGKHLDPGTTQAVSVQLARFDEAGTASVRDELERLVAARQTQAFPTAAYAPLVRSGRLQAVDTGDLPWAEIDTVPELEAARRRVAPRLAASAAVAGS